ncbi:MAG: VWA domain-containing protein [Deltaproteobacteria bacterium]|nr:VWA domain-containing protein [Nannocystaceae bacterium]
MRRWLDVATIGLLTTAWAGCAKPCFDDGLDQGDCPAVGVDTTGGSDDASETVGATTTSPTTTADTTNDPTLGTGSGGQFECPELEEVLLPQTPTFQLVVDRSGSMDEDFGGVSRWNAMVETLVGGDGVVTRLQSDIRFGLTLYSNDGMQCPTVDSLGPQLDAADEISTALAATGPVGDTPTGESLVVATQLVLDDTWEGEKVLVLATDGEPDTCAIPDPMGAEVDQVRGVAVDAVTAAFEQGIRTFVISVGPELAEEHLQDLANAGVGADAGDPATFWVASDTDSLVAAFDAIVAGIRSCEFALDKPLTAQLAPSCTVTVNDTPVAYQDANGWDLPDENTLELVGTACESIQQGVVAVALSCTCEPE